MLVRQTNGYSRQLYDTQLGGVTPRILIGDGPEIRLKFDQQTNHPVEPHEEDSRRVTVYFVGLGTQQVKLPAGYTLPKDLEDLAEVELIDPQACTVGRNLYVKAQGLKAK